MTARKKIIKNKKLKFSKINIISILLVFVFLFFLASLPYYLFIFLIKLIILLTAPFILSYIIINFKKIKIKLYYKKFDRFTNKLIFKTQFLTFFFVFLSILALLVLWISFGPKAFFLMVLSLVLGLIYFCHRRDYSIPFFENFLKKEYFKIKFKIFKIKNKKIIEGDVKQVEGRFLFLNATFNKIKLFIYAIYFKILYYLVILSKNSKESFEIIREELQEKHGKTVKIKICENAMPICEWQKDKNYANKYTDKEWITLEKLSQKVKKGEIKDAKVLEILVIKLYEFHKKNRQKAAIFSLASISIIIITTVVSGLITSLIFPTIYKSNAATGSWAQTDWAGGQSADTAIHPTNQTGWTKYSAADSYITATTSIALTASSSIISETTDTDFGAGTLDATLEISGSGSAAYVKLTSEAETATSTSARTNHGCAVISDGTVKCWGSNTYGELGNGTTVNNSVPVSVSGISTAVIVAVGRFHSCALLADNTIKCWGYNTNGQLGDGSYTQRETPVSVSGISNAVNITAGAIHTCASLSDNTVKCWGSNTYGQLGDGTETERTTPVSVLNISNASSSISTGYYHTCAILTDNTVKCWGYNNYGQLGDGTTTSTSTPVSVNEISNASSIAGGYYHTCSVLTNNTIKCWGRNSYGQLGDGTTGNSTSTPVSVSGISNASSVAGGSYHTCAGLSDNTLKCWGYNVWGNLGDGTRTQRITPVSVSGISTANSIACGEYHSCSLLSDGKIKCWGINDYGQIGNGFIFQSLTPISTNLITTASEMSLDNHTCAVLTDNTVKCWGDNTYGQLGDGTTTQRNTPITVSGLSNATKITTGYTHSCALLSDNTIKCWGRNSNGQLGDGTTTQRETPVSVSGISTAIDISAGENHTCALLTDNTVKCWGNNGNGQLGDDSTTQRETPVSVSGISTASAISINYRHSCALLSDNTVKCWGLNGNGQLGDDSTTQRETPVSVSGLSNASAITTGQKHTCALLTDNTMKCWGYNSYGRLGDGTTTQRETPVSVSGISTATDISAGSQHTCALLSDNTVKCWGYNTYGQAGDGTESHPSTPESVIGISTATNIEIGGDTSCAILSDSTIKCWGYNAYGQLGSALYDGLVLTPNDHVSGIGGCHATGTYTSQIFDTTVNTGFPTADVGSTTPADTYLYIKARSSNDSGMSGANDWDDCVLLDTTTDLTSSNCVTDEERYIQYQITLISRDISATSQFEDIEITYSAYPSSQTLTSSAYNVTKSSASISSLAWTETLRAGTDVKFQLRTSPDNSSWTDWLGPTGTGDFYTDPAGGETINSTNSDFSNDQWIQYKANLLSTTGTATPMLADITISYVTNDAPQIQNVSASQQSDGTVSISYETRDTDADSGSVDAGYIAPSFQYWNGSAWVSCTTMAAGDTDNKAVDESDYTEYTATWTATTDFASQYMNNTAEIKVIVDDNEDANNTASSTSSTFILDTSDPASPSIAVIATSSPARLIISATDDSSMQMKISLASDLAGASWESYSSSDTISLAGNPDTVYAQFKDAYSNTTSIINATTPITPTNLIIRDTTNTDTSEYQLFIAWTVINPEPSAGFKRYTVYRSTDASSYSSLVNITSTSTNYYLDQSLNSSTTYYYKITSEDNDDSISPYSSVVSDTPNGQGGTDATNPTISNVATSSISTTMAAITWDTDEVSSSTVEYITSTGGDFSSASSKTVDTMRDTSSGLGRHQIILTGLTPSTDYYFRVKSGDPAWNVATDIFGTDGYMFTTLDGAAISNVSASAITNNEATITWITDVSSDSYVVYSANSDLSNSTETGTASLLTAHSVSLSSLTQGTIYYYYVKSIDGSSNLATDNNAGNYYTFTTTQDTTAPVITFNSSTGISNTTASTSLISWTTNEAATSSVYYGLTQNSYTYSENVSNYNYNHSISLSSLSPSTTYYFKIVSTDANSNTSTDDNSGSDYSFTTLDSDGPVISSVTVADTTVTTAQITWTTSEAASSFVQYSTATTSFSSSYIEAGKNDSATSHTVDLSGLTQYQTYYYRVRSVDSTGNQTTDDNSSDYYSFTTLNGPVISSVSAAASETSSLVSWTTDSLSDSFVVYDTSSDFASSSEQGISAKTYTSHSVNLTGLSANTLYYYKVRSTAANNGATTDDDNYSFTTTEDTASPVISSVSESLIKDTQAVIAWTTDEAADSLVEYGTSSGSYPSSVSNSSLNFSHNLLLSSLSTDTVYYYHVISQDGSSNTSTSTEYSFTTLETLSEESSVETRETTARQLGRTESGGGGILTKEVIVEVKKRDKTAPVISEIRVSDITYDSSSINWKTNENANSFVEYGESSNYGEINGTFAKTKQHSVKLNNLDFQTEYNYRVLGEDNSGNLSQSSNQKFTTVSLSDSLSEDDDEEIIITQEIKESEDKLFQDVMELSKDEADMALKASSIAKKAIDIINDVSSKISIATLEPALLNQYESITEIGEIIPSPILSGEPSVLTTANTAIIAWSTNKESNSFVAIAPDETYDPDSENPYIQVVGNPDEKTTSHAITVYDLESETSYHYQIRSKAALGPIAASDDYTFTTQSEILEITNHAIQVISNEKAVFKWVTNLETDSVVKYIPYRDNTLMVEEAKTASNSAMSIIHEIIIDGFEAGVSYDIELSGKDINGGLITKPIQAFSTSKDDLPPIIYKVQTESAISPGKNAKIQTIISWFTNEPATSRIYYDEGLSLKDTFSKKTALDKNFSKKHTAVLTHFRPGTVYRFKIESIDSGGNISLSKIFTILTPRQTETVFQVILKNFEKTFSWIGKLKK